MKKYALAAALGCIASTASALCQYPLDATAAQYTQIGATPFPYINLQSAEFTATLTGTPANVGGIFYSGYSAAGVQAGLNTASTGQLGGDITLPASGIVAVEFSLDHFPAYYTSSSNLAMVLSFTTSDITTFGISLAFEASSTPDHAFVAAFGSRKENGIASGVTSGRMPLTLPLPAGFRSGIYFNMDTREVGYAINGVDYGYLKNADGTPFTIPAGVQSGVLSATGLDQDYDSADANLGQVVGATLITDRSQFTQPFPAGATDICGTTAGLRLPNGKPYPGKANPPGLQKFQSLPLPVQPLGQALKALR